MHILKLVLPLAGLLMAGQALAHKAWQATPSAGSPSRLAPAQTDTNPAALLEGMSGRGVQATSALPGTASSQPSAKNTVVSLLINRRH